MLEILVHGREVQLPCNHLCFPNICCKCGNQATTHTEIQLRKSYLLGQGEKVFNIAIPICSGCKKWLGVKRFFWKYTNLLVALSISMGLWFWGFLFGEDAWQYWVLIFCGCIPILYLRANQDHVFNWFTLGIWGYGLKKDFSYFTLKFKNDELGRQMQSSYSDKMDYPGI